MNNSTTQTAKQSEIVPFSISADDFRNEFQELSTVKVKAHETILDDFLTEIESIDFREVKVDWQFAD